MKVIVFGATGYIGTEFWRQLEEAGHTVFKSSARDKDGNLHTYGDLRSFVDVSEPDYVVNCAAFVGRTSVAQCEQQKDETISANIIVPKTLAEVCDASGVPLCHFSTGCMYDGYVNGGYKETDKPNMTFHSGPDACCFYTGTKVMAEELIDFLPDKYVWRIRLPFEEQHNTRNYFSKLLLHDRLVNAKNSIVHKKELVHACISMMTKRVPFGTYHVLNPGGISACEIVEMMRRPLGLADREFKFFESLESFNKISEIPRSNTILNTDKLASVGIELRPVHDAVEQTLGIWSW